MYMYMSMSMYMYKGGWPSPKFGSLNSKTGTQGGGGEQRNIDWPLIRATDRHILAGYHIEGNIVEYSFKHCELCSDWLNKKPNSQ